MSRKRNNVVLLYLNDEEIKLLDERVKESSYKNRNEFLRKGILTKGNVFIVDTDGIFQELQKIAAQINKFGNSVNQIAARINATNSIYNRDILDIQEAQDKIWQMLRRDMLMIDKLGEII